MFDILPWLNLRCRKKTHTPLLIACVFNVLWRENIARWKEKEMIIFHKAKAVDILISYIFIDDTITTTAKQGQKKWIMFARVFIVRIVQIWRRFHQLSKNYNSIFINTAFICLCLHSSTSPGSCQIGFLLIDRIESTSRSNGMDIKMRRQIRQCFLHINYWLIHHTLIKLRKRKKLVYVY